MGVVIRSYNCLISHRPQPMSINNLCPSQTYVHHQPMSIQTNVHHQLMSITNLCPSPKLYFNIIILTHFSELLLLLFKYLPKLILLLLLYM